MWVITQVYGRRIVSEACLNQLVSTLPPHAELHVWQDDPTEDCSWVKALPNTKLHSEGRYWGINSLRWIQLRTALAGRVEEYYLTDSDAAHDPHWYQEITRVYEAGYSISCGYRTRHHTILGVGSGFSYQKACPGISMYFQKKEASKIMLGLVRARESPDEWDFKFSRILGSSVGLTIHSVVDHYGAGGLHNSSWDDDVCDIPTPYLETWRKDNLPIFKASIPSIPDDSILRTLWEKQGHTVVINQPQGLGDILFMQPIANRLVEVGYKVDWIVDRQFLSIQKHFPNVNFVGVGKYSADLYDVRRPFRDNGTIYLPMRWSDSISGLGYQWCMASKYSILGMDWRGWQKRMTVVRDTSDERALAQLLGVDYGEPYSLVNTRFLSDGSGRVRIGPVLHRTIELKPLVGFTLVDWCAIIENASEIHSVGTSLQYLIELLNVTDNLYLYPRTGQADFREYDYLLEKPWKKITTSQK